MLLMFFHHTGAEERQQYFYGPGRSFFDQVTQVESSFPHREGDVVEYHVGHGVYRKYCVEAMDDKTALMRRVV